MESRRGDADEISVAHDDHAADGFSVLQVHRDELGTNGRRAQDFSMQQAGQLNVGRVLMLAGNDLASVEFGRRGAKDFPVGGRRNFNVATDFLGKLLALGQLAEGERSAGRNVRHFAASDSKGTAIYIQL